MKFFNTSYRDNNSTVPEDPRDDSEQWEWVQQSNTISSSSNGHLRRCQSSKDYFCDKAALNALITEMNGAKSFSAKIAHDNFNNILNSDIKAKQSIGTLPEPTRLTPFSGHAPSVNFINITLIKIFLFRKKLFIS